MSSSESKVLFIGLSKACNLAKKDVFGLSDPYCVITIHGVSSHGGFKKLRSWRSKTQKHTINPVWEQLVAVKVRQSDRVTFELFDENKLRKDDFLGIHMFQMSSVWDTLPIRNSVADLDHVKLRLSRKVSGDKVTGHLLVKLAFCSDSSDCNDHHSSAHSLSVEQGYEASPLGSSRSLNTLGDELPSGWEERQDANNRTYYIDHVNKRTQWERPDMDTASSPTATQTLRRHISQHDSLEGRSSDSESRILTFDVSDHCPDSEPLPPGFQVGRSANGRVFFIDHNTKKTTWIDPRTGKPTPKPGEPVVKETSVSTGAAGDSNVEMHLVSEADLETQLGPLPPGWEKRHANDRVFFVDHSTKRTQWDDPRLERLQTSDSAQHKFHYDARIKNKIDRFRSQLQAPTGWQDKFDLHVSRDNLLNDTHRVVNAASTEQLKKKINIVFSGESGLDYSGVQREFFWLLSKEIFNPYYGLFMYSAIDNYTLQINPNSGQATQDHLEWFLFIGRCMGMAIFHGRLLEAFFIRPFYKLMLNKDIDLADMESVDAEFYRSMKFLLELPVEDIGDLTFVSTDNDLFGTAIENEVCPGGADRKVTDENKSEFVRLMVEHRIKKRVGEQMSMLMLGLHEFVGPHLLRPFDEAELELVIGGIQTVDVKDWQKHTEYRTYTHNHPTIVNFWKLVFAMPNQLRTRLLQYTTGTSQLPANGFRELYGSNGPQKFCLSLWDTKLENLPVAHTCFNRLDLPPYTSYEDLRDKILKALEFNEGFGNQ